MQRFCPTCGKRYPEDITECPEDQTTTYPVSHEDDLIGRVIDNRFTITSLLGAGGMGAVYRARQHSMNREVALKVMKRNLSNDEQAITRFHREAEAASRLTGPHAITVFDFGHTDDGLLYIVMELLNGKPLSTVLADEGMPMNAARATLIAVQILDALSEAHAANVLHRDLKPDNVFLVEQKDSDDFVKVLDFGIAKILGAAGTKLTTTGMIFGTPTYMSPEQAQGIEMDARGDLYSVGVILFELLAGMPPFEAKTPLALLHQKVSGDVPVIYHVNPEVQIPEELEKAVSRLMAIDPDVRPANVKETKQLLANAMGMSSGYVTAMPDVVISGGTTKIVQAGAASPPPGADEQTLRRVQKPQSDITVPPEVKPFPWTWMAIAAAVLGVGGVFLLMGIVGPDTSEPPADSPASVVQPPAPAPVAAPAAKPAPVATPAPVKDATIHPAVSDVPAPGIAKPAVKEPAAEPAPKPVVATPEPTQKKKIAHKKTKRPRKKPKKVIKKKPEEDTDTLKLLFH